MVSPVADENENKEAVTNSTKKSFPSGNYTLVGWDMDTTGKKLIDEICQIAAYTPESSYSQYVMPYNNLNPSAKKRHGIKIITITKFRMLKDIKTNKVVPTKSEIFAVNEFIAWLESLKPPESDGIILVYHEDRKVLPTMLLESLKKYNLLDRFKQTVKGFVNGFYIAEDKNKTSNDSFSMRTLARVLFDNKDELKHAAVRAKFALDIANKFRHEEMSDNSEIDEDESGVEDCCLSFEFFREYAQTVEDEEVVHEKLKAVLKRENTLKPIFRPLFYATRRERQKASPLRRLLAEADIEYEQLQEAWDKGKKEEIEKLIKEKIESATSSDIQELLRIIECHFDEEKAQQLKLELEKVQNTKKKNAEKKRNAKSAQKKRDARNNNIDSGNDSADNTLIHTPPKVKTSATDNIQKEAVFVN